MLHILDILYTHISSNLSVLWAGETLYFRCKRPLTCEWQFERVRVLSEHCVEMHVKDIRILKNTP